MEYASLNNGVKMPMLGIGTFHELFDFELTADELSEIAAMNRNGRYYTSTPEMLKAYAEMIPPVDEQK